MCRQDLPGVASLIRPTLRSRAVAHEPSSLTAGLHAGADDPAIGVPTRRVSETKGICPGNA